MNYQASPLVVLLNLAFIIWLARMALTLPFPKARAWYFRSTGQAIAWPFNYMFKKQKRLLLGILIGALIAFWILNR